MGNSTPSKAEITLIRYANYVESSHSKLLNTVRTYRDQLMDHSESPYLSVDSLDAEIAFLGTGQCLSDFPSLHDMFGKFMAGLDIDSLFSELFSDTLAVPEIDALTEANTNLIDDNFIEDLVPKFTLAMRSLNTVMSSSFVIGKVALEDRRVRLRPNLNAALRYPLIPTITKRWIDSLNHKKRVIFSYAFSLKQQFLTETDTDRYNYRLTTRHNLWPFAILEYERAALGVFRSHKPRKREITSKRSTLSAILLTMSYMVTGMVIGNLFGPYGAILGSVIGIGVGLAIVFTE